MIVSGMMNIWEEYIKNEKFWPWFMFFVHNSKSILPQSASFSHAGTHTPPLVLFKHGCIYHKIKQNNLWLPTCVY